MKNLLACLLLIASGVSAQTTQITGLPSAGSVTSTDEFAVDKLVVGVRRTRKVTATELGSFVQSTLVCREQDGSPSVSPLDTLIFDQVDGFVVTDNGGGDAEIDWAPVADQITLGTHTTGGYAASTTEGGPATTATALAANGANCSAGSFPLGVDTSGASESCTTVTSLESSLEGVLDLQDLQGAVTDAQVPNTITVDLATTATALAANGANCSAESFPLGVDASGASESCTTAVSLESTLEGVLDLQDLQGAVTDGQVPNTITINLAATATALAANGANCSAGSYPLGVDASGAAESCTAAAAAGDIISEGNSSVEVVDAGTGKVEVTIDGAIDWVFDPNILRATNANGPALYDLDPNSAVPSVVPDRTLTTTGLFSADSPGIATAIGLSVAATDLLQLIDWNGVTATAEFDVDLLKQSSVNPGFETQDTTASVTSGDNLFTFGFNGTDGGVTNSGAYLIVEGSEDWTPGSSPGQIVFQTVPSGSNTPATAMTIQSDGDLQMSNTSGPIISNTDSELGPVFIPHSGDPDSGIGYGSFGSGVAAWAGIGGTPTLVGEITSAGTNVRLGLEFRLYDDDDSKYLGFAPPDVVTNNATCTFENDSSFIPDSCVGDGSDDDVPESGDFGAAVDLEADGSLSIDVVAAAEMADADHGDISWSGGVASIDADAVVEADLKVVDAASDEECLTYETTTGDFEWQSCDSSSGDITDVFSCSTGDCSSITIAATDLLDMSGSDASTATEGLILPQHATACAGGTAEGQACWEADANKLWIGNGATLTEVGAGDITDVFSCASGDCASITMAATDLLDMSGTDASTATEGLILPQHATACAGGTAEGQVCWEADADALHVGDGATLTSVCMEDGTNCPGQSVSLEYHPDNYPPAGDKLQADEFTGDVAALTWTTQNLDSATVVYTMSSAVITRGGTTDAWHGQTTTVPVDSGADWYLVAKINLSELGSTTQGCGISLGTGGTAAVPTEINSLYLRATSSTAVSFELLDHDDYDFAGSTSIGTIALPTSTNVLYRGHSMYLALWWGDSAEDIGAQVSWDGFTWMGLAVDSTVDGYPIFAGMFVRDDTDCLFEWVRWLDTDVDSVFSQSLRTGS